MYLELSIVGREFSPFIRENSAEIFLNFYLTFESKFVLFLMNIHLGFDLGTMVRTRRAIIRTPSPFSSEEHTPSLHEELLVEDSPSP